MATRLDRLLLLLSTGSTPVVRQTAAKQLGAIAAQRVARPSTSAAASQVYHGLDGEWSEVINLLVKVLPFLRSKQWETRTAAAQAIEYVVKAAGVWQPLDLLDELAAPQTPPTAVLADFDIVQAILNPDQLLASSGREYSGSNQTSLGKKDLVKSLGLSVPGAGDDDLGLDVEQELQDGAAQQSSSDRKPDSSIAFSSNGNGAPGEDLSHLSARERNAIKRKRKLAANPSAPPSAPPSKARKIDSSQGSPATSRSATPAAPVKQEESSNNGLNSNAVTISYKGPKGGQAAVKEETDTNSSWAASPDEWPFTEVVASLQMNLLHPEWEIRHGAAIGIREIIKVQGGAAGMTGGASPDANHAQHQAWVDQLAVDLLTVLARDRFGDFVGDQVVAPVRETASQTLSALLLSMPKLSVLRVHEVLSHMVTQAEVKEALDAQSKANPEARHGKRNYFWEVKHAGLLGLKYLVVVRPELFKATEETSHGASNIDVVSGSALVARTLATSISALGDSDDDVRSVAASLLLPIASTIVENLPRESVLELLDVLYVSLGDLADDLSSSVGNIMDLLSRLLQFPQILEYIQSSGEGRSLASLVPRLFPYFRHTITSVRKAVIDAITTFLALQSASTHTWLDIRLVRLLYQNVIVEAQNDIRQASLGAWDLAVNQSSEDPESAARLHKTVSPQLAGWLDILMTPVGQALNTAHFWKPSQYDQNASGTYDVDKAIVKQDLALVSAEQVLKGRLAAVHALATLFTRLPSDSHVAQLGPVVAPYFSSESSHQLSFAAYLLASWADISKRHSSSPSSPLWPHLAPAVLKVLESEPPVAYSETSSFLSQTHTHCQQLLGIFKNKGKISVKALPVLPTPSHGFSLQRAQQLVDLDYPALLGMMTPGMRASTEPLLAELADKIRSEASSILAMKEAMDVSVFASLASASVALLYLPAKMNPLIRSLMNGIKFENNLDLQKRTTQTLAAFIAHCDNPSTIMKSNPSEKIIKNVCSFLCQDATLTPLFTSYNTIAKGIIGPTDMQLSGTASLGAVSQPGKPQKMSNGYVASVDIDAQPINIVRRGAEFALASLCAQFGDEVIAKAPRLWLGATDALVRATEAGLSHLDNLCEKDLTSAQDLLDGMTVLEALALSVPSSLVDTFLTLLQPLIVAIQCKFAVVRHVAARVLTTLCVTFTEAVMKTIVTVAVPLMGDPLSLARRRGGIELVSNLVDRLDLKILPYIIFLIVPVLGRMTDPDEETRTVATRTFATLVKLVPLEAAIPDPVGFPKELLQKRDEERRFFGQLLGTGQIEDYQMPIKVSVDLRKYQREGISWLAFLARYQLHGILCDDMGLGKTLQTICILGSKTKERAAAHAASKSPATVHLPSLVVCPPTLMGHWRHEIHTYVPELACTVYGGVRAERIKRAGSLRKYDIVVTSYDIVRNDIDVLGSIEWNYCVLDEGHIIKNGKTKLSQAIKTIHANHRLILSGTPIQNNVLELWNLFDFLMPGFLGTEAAFSNRYAKPIQHSREAKSSSKEQESGALALEALHKQVLPFVLRRLKKDVLDDLPPKIIQDYYCDLSPLQRDLYENFTKSSEDNAGSSTAKLEDDEESKVPKAGANGKDAHVFQTLQYLRRLVNHPQLVIQPDKQDHLRILSKHGFTAINDKKLRDLTQAPKLLALNGIGEHGVKTEEQETGSLDSNDVAIAPHRVLIFCQMKTMLDLIEDSLFAAHMPSVSYLRLDGNTPSNKRHAVVQTFNADPSIDVLLLTTHVGGLGLNLTGADTVIFVEHDWNPMRDLQAMDRAHRLGQKRVVNVYRLITKGTLEEKIMGLQRFKMNIASTVVSQQNADMATMDTENVLDLLAGGEEDASKPQKTGKLSQKEMLQSLSELDDESHDDYNEMGSASGFADSLRA